MATLAQKLAVKADSARRASLRGITFWDDPAPPASTLGEYIQGQRAARVALNPRGNVAAFVARYGTIAGPDFLAALDNATQLAQGTSSFAGSFGAVGSIAGGAIGLVGGLVMGLIPTERNAAEARWDAIVSAMPPLQRFGVAASIKPVAARACESESEILPGGSALDRCGPWRWANDPPLGHSPWGGPIGRTVNLLERLARRPWLPPGVSMDTPEHKSLLALWVVLFCAGAHDDGKMPWEMRAMWPLIAGGNVAPMLVAECGPYSNVKLGKLRAQAVERGITTIFNPPLSPQMRKALAG